MCDMLCLDDQSSLLYLLSSQHVGKVFLLDFFGMKIRVLYIKTA